MRHRLSLLLTLGSGLLLAACAGSKDAAAKPRRPALRVRAAPVAVEDVVYQIKALGSLEAQDLVQVTAQVDGVASEVGFREGDRVTPQTVLLRIDPERYRLEFERAKAALDQATAELRRAEADQQRRETLARAELLSAEELTRSRSDSARLAASVEVSRAALGIARQNLERAEVRSQAAGVINTRSVDTGQFVRAGVVLATIVDTTRLRLRFKVSDAESLRAGVGGRVGFRVAALGPREFEARIYHVGRAADPTTRQVEVLGWVDEVKELKPGFFAEVLLAGERRQSAVVVPESAVQASEQGFVTYVVSGGKAQLRPVQLGLRTGTGVVEILSGLKPGETVVTEGSDRLGDGMVVEVLPGRPAGASPRAAAEQGRP